MTLRDDYTPSTALSAYYQSRTERSIARLWAVEKALHDAAGLGIVSFFEGSGSNPSSLPGYSSAKLWLQVSAGVTETPGTVLRYTGIGDPTSSSNWVALTPAGFWTYLRDVGGGFLDVPVDADYPTRAAVIAATVPGTIGFIRTAGYAAMGDGGGALYVRTTAGTANSYRFQSADGSWWILVVDTPVPEQFGAKGDGTTNDTQAFVEGFERSTVLFGRPTAIYVVQDLVINGRSFDGRGCGFRDASGSKWGIKVRGFGPELRNCFIQDQGHYVRATTTSASALAAATTITVTSATGFEVGQVLLVTMAGNILPHLTVITGVSGTTITMRDAVPGAVDSGAEVVALYSLIWVETADHYKVDNVQVINGRGVLLIKPLTTSPLQISNRGLISNVDVSGARYFGRLKMENAAGVKELDLKLWCGWVDTKNYTGDGTTTTYAVGSSVFLKRDVSVTVAGVASVEGVGWNYSGNNVVFVSAPANGAAVVIYHYRAGYYGYVDDQRNTAEISGGNACQQVEVLACIAGAVFYETELTNLDQFIVDSSSGTALTLIECAASLKFEDTFLGFANRCLYSYNSNGVFFGSLFTQRVPVLYVASGVVADNIYLDLSQIWIDVGRWTGGDYQVAGTSTGILVPKNGREIVIGTTSTIPAATVGFAENYGAVTYNVGAPTTVLLFRAFPGNAPGAGQSFTYDLMTGATVVATATISGTGVFGTGTVRVNYPLLLESGLSLRVTTSAGAAAVKHRCTVNMT